MGMTVRTNVASMMASGRLGRTNKGLSESLAKISSGMRINKAADDAAGLGVATNLETQVLSTRQAMRNTNDGISIIQTAESATNEVVDILQRMRELAIQSASETLDDDERAYIQDEFEELQDEIQRIASSTQFNGVSLTNASNTTLDVQGRVGRVGQRHTVELRGGGDPLDLVLQLFELVLDVGALVVIQGLRGGLDGQLAHPLQDVHDLVGRRLRRLDDRDAIVGVPHGLTGREDLRLEVRRHAESGGVIRGLVDPHAAGDLGERLGQALVGAPEAPRRHHRGDVGAYGHSHGLALLSRALETGRANHESERTA